MRRVCVFCGSSPGARPAYRAAAETFGALLDTDGYFASLLAFLDHAVDERFVRPPHRAMLLVDDAPEPLLDAMTRYRAPDVEKWIDRSET